MRDGFEAKRGWRRDPADEGERGRYVARKLAESDVGIVSASCADFHAVEAR